LAAKNGHELWRASLPFAPYPTPRDPHALFASRARVFCLGKAGDHAVLLSGFDATTGQPTLAYSLPPWSHVALRDEGSGLLWASSWPSGTVAFDSSASLRPRSVSVSGSVVHRPGSVALGRSLGGIAVCSLDECVQTDRQGAFVLRAEARGQMPVWVDPGQWLDAQHGLPQPPRGMFICAKVEPLTVDVEARASARWDPALLVTYCPIR